MKTLIIDQLEKSIGRLVKYKRVDDKHSNYLVPMMGGYVGVSLMRDAHSFVFNVISNDLGDRDTFQTARVFVGTATKVSSDTKMEIVKAINDTCEAVLVTYHGLIRT